MVLFMTYVLNKKALNWSINLMISLFGTCTKEVDKSLNIKTSKWRASD